MVLSALLRLDVGCAENGSILRLSTIKSETLLRATFWWLWSSKSLVPSGLCVRFILNINSPGYILHLSYHLIPNSCSLLNRNAPTHILQLEAIMDLFAALPPLRWLIYESRVPTRHIAIAGLCFASALALQATFSKPPKCDKHCRHEEKRPRVKCRCCSRAGQPLPSRRGHDHNQSTQTPKKEIPVGLVKDIHHKEPRKQVCRPKPYYYYE